ncbi:MAG: diguanylate cyclase [Acidobacteria bacterium]|nr:diguanylate cyclase [Acidobacteriota bacterium]
MLANSLQEHLGGRAQTLEGRICILESALESMGDGVVVVDEQGKFLLCNSAARRIYGRDPIEGGVERWAETYGIFLPDRITPFPSPQLPLARALRGESTDQIELFFCNAAHPDGIFVESTGRSLRDGDNRVYGGIVVLRDISLHKQAEIELRDTNQRLSQLVAEQARRAQQSGTLAEMSSLLQATATVDELYAVIADYFERLFSGAPGAFFIYSASRDDLEQKSCWGGYALLEESALIRPSECWGLRRGRAHRLDQPSGRLRCAHIRSLGEGAICAPVLGPSETIGLLHLRFGTLNAPPDPHQAGLWDEREQIAVTAAEYLGLALVNLRLRTALQQQSIRDPLTGLFNRRFMEETLTREIRRAQRNHTSVSVLMLDIDHFKLFNDRHGHSAGDAVLREFSTLLNDSIRGADVASRYGGEEFTILLPDTPVGDARRKAEQLLKRVKALRLSFNGREVGTITASGGVAAFAEHGEHAEDLLHAADAALYAAKQGGRNRVEVAARPGVAV